MSDTSPLSTGWWVEFLVQLYLLLPLLGS